MSALSADACQYIRTVLVDREDMTPERADSVIEELEQAARSYLEDREDRRVERTHHVPELLSWLQRATGRTQAFRAWLETNPAAMADTEFSRQLVAEREALIRALDSFLAYLQWVCSPAPAHRPVDSVRACLEDSIGLRLAEAGVRLTTSPTGTLGLILGHAFDDLGLQSIDLTRACRRIVDSIGGFVATHHPPLRQK
jgi:hypothetical protein